jgi:hypothetical protein
MVSFTDDVIDQKPNRNQLIDLTGEYLNEIVAFSEKAPDLLAPYIKLAQKNTPFWRP